MTKLYDPRTEILIDGGWVDITTDVRTREKTIIMRGRPDEASRVNPTNCSLKLNQRHGKYAPRDPRSVYFGKIGRNTPLRVRLPGENIPASPLAPPPIYDSRSGPATPPFTGNFSWTHTPVAARIHGVVVWVIQNVGTTDEVTSVTYGGVPMAEVTGSPFVHTAGAEDGVVYLYFLGATIPQGPQTVQVNVNGTGSAKQALAFAIRSLLSDTTEVDDVAFLDSAGVANPTVTLNLSTGSWVAAALHSGLDSIFSAVPLDPLSVVGFDEDIDFGSQSGLFAFLDNNVVLSNVDPVAGDLEVGWDTLDVSEEAGLVAVAIRNGPSDARFHGEVPDWPQRASTGDIDKWVTINAAGIMRRLGQGSSKILSAPHAFLTKYGQGGLLAYWPLEEGSLAASASEKLGAGAGGPMQRITTFGLGTLGPFAPLTTAGSGQLGPWLPSGLLAPAAGAVVNMTQTPIGGWAIDFIYNCGQDSGFDNFLLFVEGNGAGTVGAEQNDWQVAFSSSGAVNTELNIDDGTPQTYLIPEVQLPADLFIDRQPHHLRFAVNQVNTNQLRIRAWVDGTLYHDQTFNTQAVILDGIRRFAIQTTVGDALTVGHVTIRNTTSVFLSESVDAALGHPGEPAGLRMQRLCAEHDVDFTCFGDINDTAALGPQYVDTLLNVLQECADTDLGILFEPRQFLGLAYRTRASLYNQNPTLALTYGEGTLGSSLEPTPDDQLTRNDITVTRRDGASTRAVQETGPLNVNQPADDPQGVGRYEDAPTINVVGDEFLPNQASWRRHLGTVDEERFPRIHLKLHGTKFRSDPALALDAATLDIGDGLTIADPPTGLPPEPISQLAQHLTEEISLHERDIYVNGAPESPYQVGVYEAAEGDVKKYDTAGSSLAADFDAGTDTSMSVDVDVLPLWTTDDDETPVDIEVGGVILQVTDITGASSPQTFTITQTPVNGVVKTITAGTAVRLAPRHRAVYAL